MGDLSAAIVAYFFASTMSTGKPGMQAVQSFVVSVIARIAAKSGMADFMGKLDTTQKNQIVVAILSAIGGSYKGGSPLKAAISGVSVDLLAEDLLRLLNQDPNSGFFQMGGAGPAVAPASTTSLPPRAGSAQLGPGFMSGRVS
jgi:hypothetical protein